MKQFKHALPVILILLTGLFSSCNNKPSTDAVSATVDSTTTPPAPPAPPVAQDNANWASEDGLYAVFTNTKGKIVCKLEYTKAPLTVSNFVTLTEGKNTKATVNKGKPFYNGLTWHRVEPGFVIQGGDPAGNGSGGCGYAFPDEIDPSLSHKLGTLAMANSGPNTNGSQIYITKSPTPSLDGHYNIFGYVVSGMSVVNAIAIGDKMDTVTIVRVGKDAQAWDAVSTFNTKIAAAQKVMDDAKKKQYEQMQAAIKQHNAQVAKMSAEYKGWDAKAKAKYPGAKRTASGLYYIVSTPGTGAMAKPGQTVVAHYTGTLWDGKKFDSSKDRGQPFEFAIGQHQVIDGWDEGFGLFKVGAKGKLIIPYYLAYGEQGAGGGAIPSKADLIFDVEMLGVK
jgi:peptidyl-prolyl cis-trans isomerase A (cyclophilin A)